LKYGNNDLYRSRNTFHFAENKDVQLTVIYFASDIIPQGKINSRFSLDLKVDTKKYELFIAQYL
jgi:hypothetical protein